MSAYDVTLDFSHIDKTVESIKIARGRMLRACGPNARLTLHRKLDIEHNELPFCICDPVVITQHDWRTSEHFAREILFPQIH